MDMMNALHRNVVKPKAVGFERQFLIIFRFYVPSMRKNCSNRLAFITGLFDIYNPLKLQREGEESQKTSESCRFIGLFDEYLIINYELYECIKPRPPPS